MVFLIHVGEALKTHCVQLIKDKTTYIVFTKRQVILLAKTFAKISPKNHKSIFFLLSNIHVSQHYSIQGQCYSCCIKQQTQVLRIRIVSKMSFF